MVSTVQMVDGHYQLSLPWKYEKPSLPNNRAMALKRLDLLKRCFQKDVDLKRKYKETVEEYISLGHVQKIPGGQVGSPVWYLLFRQEQIGISADTEKMFHQVRVSPQDTHGL